jgi:integrase
VGAEDMFPHSRNPFLECEARGVKSCDSALAKPSNSVSLSDFSRMYLKNSSALHTPKTVTSSATALRELARFLGADIPLEGLTVVDCEKFLAVKASEASLWTASKYYAALSAVFQRAVVWGYLKQNVWKSVKRPRTPEVIPEYLSRSEYAALRRSFPNPVVRDMADLAVLTGMRMGEIVATRWSWVDLGRRLITLRNTAAFTTKSKKCRTIPLCPDAVALLQRLATANSNRNELVFHVNGMPIRGDSVSHAFKRCARKTGIRDEIHFHSLRHTFASWLVESGVSIFQVSKLLGHASTTTTLIYSHLLPEQMHSVLGAIYIERPEDEGQKSPSNSAQQRSRPEVYE